MSQRNDPVEDFVTALSDKKVKDLMASIFEDQRKSALLEIENLKVYLYVSVKNLSIKYLSRNKPRIDFSLNDILLEHVADTSQNPEDLMVSKEMFKSIHTAIENLPPKCRLIFKLVREDGLKYKEIAQILNISVKTIDAQMAIAGKRVIQSLSFLIRK